MRYFIILLLLPMIATAQPVTETVLRSDTNSLDYTRFYGNSQEQVPPTYVIIDSLRRVIDQTAPEGSWDDERIPITSVRVPGTGSPGWTQIYQGEEGSTGVGLYCFDDANEESVYFTLQLPHSWLGAIDGYDSTLNFHVHWLHTSPDTGTVVWGLEYTWASVATDSSARSTYGPNTILAYSGSHPVSGSSWNNVHLMTVFEPITKPDQGWSSMLICRFFRATDVGATLTADACVLEIDCHILKRPRGTRGEYSDE